MRILVIEDDRRLSEALQTLLKRENYMVDARDNGEDGLEQALTSIYDIIILDIMLPKMNGFQVLDTLRREKIKTPILMLTAKDDVDDMVLALDNGADDYLTKPFQTKELLARVRAVSRRRGEVENNELKYKNLLLDIKKCEIRNASTGESIKLGAKEFQLFKYILGNRNQVVTREQIVEKIWGFDSSAEYNNVEVYISFIRKKIDFIGCEVKIRAIRGIGYIVED